jgi:hypothetical protein
MYIRLIRSDEVWEMWEQKRTRYERGEGRGCQPGQSKVRAGAQKWTDYSRNQESDSESASHRSRSTLNRAKQQSERQISGKKGGIQCTSTYLLARLEGFGEQLQLDAIEQGKGL